MIDNAFRRYLLKTSRSGARWLGSLGVHPNHLTWIGFLGSLLAATLVVFEMPYLALATWWIFRLADGWDGLLAREMGKSSDLGAYLDITLDMLAYGIFAVAISVSHPGFELEFNLVLLGYIGCITSALALGAATKASNSTHPNPPRRLELAAGLAEGGETGLFYTTALLWPEQLQFILAVWIAMLAFTVVARTIMAYRVLSSTQ